MPFITRRLLSKVQQPLVNAAKAADTVKASVLVHGVPNSKPTKVKDPTEAGTGEIGWTTQSREELARVFPHMVAKQDYHISMVKKGIPVHKSGPYDSIQTKVFYGSTFILFAYFMYLYYEMIKNS
ncbi:unnamed protein product [Clavelina lepadiformis]|uniref:Uncharacterized protein n=1 Tax=Clavelina lepadiformis TaxID=159417 RepID=A0ABP0FE82_CLALP